MLEIMLLLLVAQVDGFCVECGAQSPLCKPSHILMAEQPKQQTPYLDRDLSRQLVFNQLAVSYPIWSGGIGAQILNNQVHLDNPIVWLLGIIGALPILGVGRAIEKSPAPLFTTLNLSTNNIVERLFGEEKQPAFALVVSVFLALLTGVGEEILFRGQIFPALCNYGVEHGYATTLREAIPFGATTSTIAFAFGHLPFFGGLANLFSRDSLVLFALQLATGATFMACFLLSGDLTTPIVAHFLYDL